MITVIGFDGSEPSPAARARLDAAALVTGAERILRRVRTAVPPVPAADDAAAVAAVEAHLERGEGPAVVVADGDPGFFGVVRALRERGLAPEVLPAASLVTRAFGRAGLPWEDALVLAAPDLRRAANVCRAHHKVAVLTAPGIGPAELARALAPTTPRALIVFEDLGGPGERITHSRMGEATTRPWRDPALVLVLDPRHRPAERTWLAGARPGPGRWALDFTSAPHAVPGPAAAAVPGSGAAPGAVPWAGPEARAFVLARLGPRLGAMVWDVGAGAGDVAVECARFGAAVVAVERDPARCETIKRNVLEHHVKVALTRGDAPAALEPLPDPDAVHVGGGGPAVVAACAARSPESLVCTLGAADRVPALLTILREHGYHAEGLRLHASRLDGAHHLAPNAPVYIVHGTRIGPG
ncbi:precorrin-6y C5,15-methyltransferase subunit CbiE [Microtetraspora sp. NBRC 13810]|uniref:bifunctional cobalt-precorrin-7 (C(5))-methyltransferase/cobalt-precorrin-6B (C(15))-methyltransferase n=1 Tax=Microtetraspora sp. NBRC 13810 TaxID=3030990 RepID=UPI0024A5CCD8|nr:bifunctional cobalt-precorrin-7 (C(5))-methyltransferase CbiE/decarboxylating cobalt-precorrin-6B (C(15))-methyltransferase CbiT [Microtetraspora sp. NBRC 13810]GLW10798.1 precorrin-6y C5,15-methyltransferase subunit CbiE [Microtetraspora sp. NBRC 13810]